MTVINMTRVVKITPGQIYRRDNGRLFSEKNNLSFLVPAGYIGQEIFRNIFVIKDDAGLVESTLYLHNSLDILVGGWMDEKFDEGEEVLQPTGKARPILGGRVREFASPAYVGYKVECNDLFRNGVGGVFRAPRGREGDLRSALREVMNSLRFLQIGPMSEDQTTDAVAHFAVSDAETGRDLMLYINRYFYTLRDEVREGLHLTVHQAEKEAHPGFDQLKSRLALLDKCRESVLADGWSEEFAAELWTGHEEL